jgi:hypothetical protein
MGYRLHSRMESAVLYWKCLKPLVPWQALGRQCSLAVPSRTRSGEVRMHSCEVSVTCVNVT